MAQQRTTCAIVGGGPAGIVLGLVLARAGVDEGGGHVATLARRGDEALQALGFAPEPRAFTAHATLGRLRAPRADPRLAEALATGGTYGRQRVDRVALMRSRLSPRGACHTQLAAAPLAPGAPG